MAVYPPAQRGTAPSLRNLFREDCRYPQGSCPFREKCAYKHLGPHESERQQAVRRIYEKRVGQRQVDSSRQLVVSRQPEEASYVLSEAQLNAIKEEFKKIGFREGFEAGQVGQEVVFVPFVVCLSAQEAASSF